MTFKGNSLRGKHIIEFGARGNGIDCDAAAFRDAVLYPLPSRSVVLRVLDVLTVLAFCLLPFVILCGWIYIGISLSMQ